MLELAEAKRDAGRDVVEIEEAPPEDEEDIGRHHRHHGRAEAAHGRRARTPARAEPARAPSARRGASVRRDALADKSKKELYEQAKKSDLPGRSAMSREELIAALRKAG